MPETQTAPQKNEVSYRKVWQTPLVILSEINGTQGGDINATPESTASTAARPYVAS